MGLPFSGFNNYHIPQPYLKETYREVWKKAPSWLEHTAGHKFREMTDISLYIFTYWQYLPGKFEPYDRRKAGHYMTVGCDLDAFCDIVTGQKYKMLCLNDFGVTDYENARKKILEAFETILPKKSRYENGGENN